ncbi:MAG: class IV adenylate cyclase [Planctomycetota bacterium]
MHEIELKFAVENHVKVQARLSEVGAIETKQQNHVDTYFNHPCRDFAETTEALRVRVVDGVPKVTYKGSKLQGTGDAAAVKARLELEFDLHASDRNGEKMQTLLRHIGFVSVGQVKKRRRIFQWPGSSSDNSDAMDFPTEVTLDEVEHLGTYIEIETILEHPAERDNASTNRSESTIQAAREHLLRVAQILGLGSPEPRSYLRLTLERSMA